MHKYIHLHTIYYTDTRVSHSIRRSRATKELSRCAETGFFIFLRQRSAFYANERMRSPTYVKYSQTFRDFNSFIPSSIFRRVRKTRAAFYANERMYRHDDFTWKVTKKNVAKLSRGFETCFSSREFWNDSYLKKNYQVDYQFPN